MSLVSVQVLVQIGEIQELADLIPRTSCLHFRTPLSLTVRESESERECYINLASVTSQ